MKSAGHQLGPVGLVFLILLLLMTGCADFQKKFIRKKKPVAKPQFLTEPVPSSYDALYRERFAYWKGWQGELVKDLGKNRKRERRDVLEARRHLASLQNYLEEDKARALSPHIADFDRLTRFIRSPKLPARLSDTERALLGRRLELLQIRIENQFSPRSVKTFLKASLPPIDLTPYADEDEVPLPSSLRAGENSPERVAK